MSLPRIFLPSAGSSVSCALSGTITASDETDVVSGGQDIVLELTGDTWIAAGASFDAQRQAIINGLTSAGSETRGWNNEVRDTIPVTNVVRTSSTVVTITLSAASDYSITANETITVTIPAAALVTSAVPVVASPTFTISVIAATVTLSGTILSATEESDIVTGGKTIALTLNSTSGERWVAAGATFDAQRQAIIDGLDSDGVEAAGWDAVVKVNEVVTAVVRTSSTVVTITLSAHGTYSITALETITATIPAAALEDSSAPIVASPTFDVANTVAKTITLTDLTDNRIYQRTVVSNNAAILISGSYTGAITSVEARAVLDGTSTEVVTWTAIDASPSGGNFSGSLTVPADDQWYNVQVRMSNDVSVVDNGANQWGIGMLIGCTGQSNMSRWFNQGSGGTPDDRIRKYDGTWSALGAAATGAEGFGEAILAGMGANAVLVGLLDYGVSGSTIGNWETAPHVHYDLFKTGVDAVGGALEYVFWSQGEANAGTPEATYETALNNYTTLYRSEITNGSDQTNLPLIIEELGRRTDGVDSEYQDIRNAQNDVAALTADVYIGSRKIDLPLADTVHLTAAGHGTSGERMAQCVLFILGEETYYQGPSIASYKTNSTTETDVDITHNAGSDFTPTSAITGFEVLDAGTPEVISAAVRQDADTIRLTHGAVAGAKTVRYQYGANPVVTGPVLDNSGETLPLKSEETIGFAAATASVTGTLAGASWETLRDTGGTVIFTLNGDAFIAAGTGPIGTIAQSNDFVNAFTSAQSEAGGWNAQVRDILDQTDLTRDSDTQATLTVPATAGYLITEAETIRPVAQAAILVTSGIDVTASPFNIFVASDRTGGGVGAARDARIATMRERSRRRRIRNFRPREDN